MQKDVGENCNDKNKVITEEIKVMENSFKQSMNQLGMRLQSDGQDEWKSSSKYFDKDKQN